MFLCSTWRPALIDVSNVKVLPGQWFNKPSSHIGGQMMKDSVPFGNMRTKAVGVRPTVDYSVVTYLELRRFRKSFQYDSTKKRFKDETYESHPRFEPQ